MPWCLYEHVFPNGKKYIGISKDPEKRWRNGSGYESQSKIANAIKRYGWENVKHNIIMDGLTKEQAERLEQYLIAELKTIPNGYNTAKGGSAVNGTYLAPYILDMCRYVKNRGIEDEYAGIARLCFAERYDSDSAGFWNEAESAVTKKHRKYSTTNEDDVLCFWFYMMQYLQLYTMHENGEDVSMWREIRCPFERLVF